MQYIYFRQRLIGFSLITLFASSCVITAAVIIVEKTRFFPQTGRRAYYTYTSAGIRLLNVLIPYMPHRPSIIILITSLLK